MKSKNRRLLLKTGDLTGMQWLAKPPAVTNNTSQNQPQKMILEMIILFRVLPLRIIHHKTSNKTDFGNYYFISSSAITNSPPQNQ